MIELTADWRRSMNAVIAAMREVDEDTRKMLKDMIRELAALSRKRLTASRSKGTRAEGAKQAVSVDSTGGRRVKKK